MSKRGITLNNCLGEGVSVADRGKGFIQINGRGVLLPEGEAIRLRDWLNAKYPAPPAAAHGDERAAFERYVANELQAFRSSAVELSFRCNLDGEYIEDWVQDRWEGWQARAAMRIQADEGEPK